MAPALPNHRRFRGARQPGPQVGRDRLRPYVPFSARLKLLLMAPPGTTPLLLHTQRHTYG